MQLNYISNDLLNDQSVKLSECTGQKQANKKRRTATVTHTYLHKHSETQICMQLPLLSSNLLAQERFYVRSASHGATSQM